MKTASVRSYTGPGRISIARWVRGAPAGYKIYSALAPGPWFRSVRPEEYCALYAKILENRDPLLTYYELHNLVSPAEPVLLCWEKPPFTESNFCHRRMVAAWFEKTLGVPVLEVGAEPARGPEFPDPFQDWLDSL